MIMAYLLSIMVGLPQCPKPGTEVQTPACMSPTNATIVSVSCNEVKVGFNGNEDQEYVVSVTITDGTSGLVRKLIAEKIICNRGNKCIAAIPVGDNDRVSWKVQAICNIMGATVYSMEVQGEDVQVPGCINAKNQFPPQHFNVYPNPATDYLLINFRFEGERDAIQFAIFDASGKKVLEKLQSNQNNGLRTYRMDIKGLVPGTYMLEATNGGYTNRSKFLVVNK